MVLNASELQTMKPELDNYLKITVRDGGKTLDTFHPFCERDNVSCNAAARACAAEVVQLRECGLAPSVSVLRPGVFDHPAIGAGIDGAAEMYPNAEVQP
jgi:hypothetical protein